MRTFTDAYPVPDAGGYARQFLRYGLRFRSYYPESEGLALPFRIGYDGQVDSVNNTQVYVMGNDQHIVVAFRGSESSGHDRWPQGLAAHQRHELR
ncbi:MAG: hypothetical protein U0798_02580 [Gemmataceae bacterium]